MTDDPRKAEHEERVNALREANAESAKMQAIPPTPTQEENDLMALGLMNPDDKQSGVPKESGRRSEPHHTSAEQRQHAHQDAAERGRPPGPRSTPA